MPAYRLLLSLARKLTPRRDREWLDALIAELPSVADGRERRAWLGGAPAVLAAAFWRRAVSDAWLVPVCLITGSVLAYFNLEAGSRLPYALLLGAVVGLISFVRPEWSWRWALLLQLCLPAAVALGFEGPYQHDRLDALYALPPALAIALVASWLRSRIDNLRLA